VTNLACYAYAASPSGGRFSIEAWLEGPEARIRILDEGVPFDVAAAKDPGIETDIASASVGGRGIRLMRKFSQSLAYERRSDANILTFAFLRGGPPTGR
jgi:anti-sigma regulatory factor (Ser/Thr protein kinase)